MSLLCVCISLFCKIDIYYSYSSIQQHCVDGIEHRRRLLLLGFDGFTYDLYDDFLL